MNSLNAFQKLEVETRKGIIDRCIFRKKRYMTERHPDGAAVGKILLIGDKPAPSAPDDPGFHYTPFAALWHSSLYINKALHDAGIDEAWLFWENAYTLHDVPKDGAILTEDWGLVVALGGAAHRWMLKNGRKPDATVHHPAAWKRFHSKESYPLIEELLKFIDGRKLLPELPHHGYRL